MRVNNASVPSSDPERVKEARDVAGEQAQAPAGQAAGEADDKVTLSELARAVSPSEEARLARLEAEIAEGRYSVPSETIAARMIDAHLKKPGE